MKHGCYPLTVSYLEYDILLIEYMSIIPYTHSVTIYFIDTHVSA